MKIVEEDKYIVFLIKLLKKAKLENLFIERFISNIKSRNIVVDGYFSSNNTPVKLDYVDDMGNLLIITKNVQYSLDTYQEYLKEWIKLNVKQIFGIFLNDSHVNIEHLKLVGNDWVKVFKSTTPTLTLDDVLAIDWEVVE
jgi:hypothetical protein